jgi:hypothetical protein
MFSLSVPIGDDYSGQWRTSTSLQITINDANVDIAPEIGVLQIAIKDHSGIKDSTNTSNESQSTHLLSGSFGTFTDIIDVCETGTASSILPSGIVTSVSSIDECTTFTMTKEIDGSSIQNGLIGILGSTVDISPKEGNAASVCGDDGCQVSFIFSSNDASNLGLSPYEVRIQHDENDNGILEDDEFIDSIVIQIDDHLFLITASVDHFSKFAISGVKAFAIGGLALNSNAGDSNGPIIGDTSLELVSSDDGGFGGKLYRTNLKTLTHSLTFKPNDELIFSVPITEEHGIQNIEHIGLYLDNVGTDLRSKDYDTSIVYEKYGKPELVVTDPYNLFESSDVKILETDRINGIIEFNLVFSKPMDTSNLYVTIWNIEREPASYTFENILTISDNDSLVPVFQQEAQFTHIPKWIKNNAGWWSDGSIGDTDFMSGIQYLIDEDIVHISTYDNTDDISHVSTSDNPENMFAHIDSSIPSWVKNNAKWWSEDTISEDDFVSGIQYMVNNGILHVGSR